MSCCQFRYDGFQLTNRSLSLSDGTAVDLNLFFFVPAGAAGVVHTGHNNSAHTAHSVVTNLVIYVYVHIIQH